MVTTRAHVDSSKNRPMTGVTKHSYNTNQITHQNWGLTNQTQKTDISLGNNDLNSSIDLKSMSKKMRVDEEYNTYNNDLKSILKKRPTTSKVRPEIRNKLSFKRSSSISKINEETVSGHHRRSNGVQLDRVTF